MIRTKTRDRSKRFLAGATIALASVGITACSSIGDTPEGPDVEENPADPNNGGNNDGNNDGENNTGGNNGGTNNGDQNNTGGTNGGNTGTTGGGTNGGTNGPAPTPPCGKATADAKVVLETYCVSCHGPIPANNGLANILDAEGLIKRGTVVPDDPENSPLYKRISTNTMPPASVQKRPSADDIKAVHDWIQCGGTFEPGSPALPFVDLDTRLEEMLDDVQSIRNEADRLNTRYIELYSLANAGYSEKQLEEYRQAVSFLLNSLSSGLSVVAPRAVGKDRLLLRFDITDYGWDADLWDEVTEEYPYIVVYDEDSELFPVDEGDAEELRDETGDDVPFIQADWFLTNMSKPPLYNVLLNLPVDFNVLQQQFGIDVAENVADANIDRVGIEEAGPSDANRIFERHELGGNQGGFWVSYDFATSIGDQNIFENPLDFEPDGGEAIFNLPNGFFGYYVLAGDPAGGEAVQLDVGPINVVQDPAARDGQVTTGLSCMNCHVKGLIVRDDEIRADALRNGAEDINAVLDIYTPVAEMRELFEEDNNRYLSANAAAGITVMNDKSMHTLHNTHLDGVTLDVVAGVLGITIDELKLSIDQASAQLPRAIVTLRREGGTLDRDTLEDVFPDLVEAIGLGQARLQ